MDDFENFLQENIDFEIKKTPKITFFLTTDIDPNTFEEFLEPKEYVDHGHLFATDRIFNSKIELVDWVKETTMKVNTYLIVTRYLKSRTSERIRSRHAAKIGPCLPLTLYHQYLSLNKVNMRKYRNQYQPGLLETSCSKKEASNYVPGPLTSFNGS
ncbi:hypothetical protein M9H77_09030 [Catharanthus roseus]|uniref:Uncharacterized protein n=1 Tax=Catharanthus roseus TaxID=4058 RepID=A0ACC0BZI8_CATRO|nr:hypothetical protein M9H77_09030 [Catharanthus roseus]